MQIHVNGEPRDLADDVGLEALLDELGLATDRVAVEVNRALVPRASFGRTTLADGDRVEIVTLVGGG
jgi:thiamine biosynthesis protein ThiS